MKKYFILFFILTLKLSAIVPAFVGGNAGIATGSFGLSIPYTTGSNSGDILIGFISIYNGAVPANVALSWNGVNMALYYSASQGTNYSYYFYLTGTPANTTANLVASHNSSVTQINAGLVEYTGQDPFTPFIASRNNTGDSKAISTTVSSTFSASNLIVVLASAVNSSDFTYTQGSSAQIPRAGFIRSTNNNVDFSFNDLTATGSAMTITNSVAPASNWAQELLVLQAVQPTATNTPIATATPTDTPTRTPTITPTPTISSTFTASPTPNAYVESQSWTAPSPNGDLTGQTFPFLTSPDLQQALVLYAVFNQPFVATNGFTPPPIAQISYPGLFTTQASVTMTGNTALGYPIGVYVFNQSLPNNYGNISFLTTTACVSNCPTYPKMKELTAMEVRWGTWTGAFAQNYAPITGTSTAVSTTVSNLTGSQLFDYFFVPNSSSMVSSYFPLAQSIDLQDTVNGNYIVNTSSYSPLTQVAVANTLAGNAAWGQALLEFGPFFTNTPTAIITPEPTPSPFTPTKTPTKIPTLPVGSYFNSVGELNPVSPTGYPITWIPQVDNGGIVYGEASYNGTLYCVGRFSTVQGGVPRNNAAAFDETLGVLLPWNPNLSGIARAITICVSGGTPSAIIGGDFTAVGGVPYNGLAAVDLNQGLPMAWSPAMAQNASIDSLCLSYPWIYVGGLFTLGSFNNGVELSVSSTSSPIVATAPWNPNPNGRLWTIVNTGSTLLLGGSFGSVQNIPRQLAAEVDPVYGAPTNWNPSIGDASGIYAVKSMSLQNGVVYIGGNFPSIASGLVGALNLSAFSWPAGVPLAWNPGANSTVEAVASYPWGILVGGKFTNTGGENKKGLAAIVPELTQNQSTPNMTPTNTSTLSPTFSVSPTFSISPTITPTPSITATRTITTTFSQTATISPTLATTPCNYNLIEYYAFNADGTAYINSSDFMYVANGSSPFAITTTVCSPYSTQYGAAGPFTSSGGLQVTTTSSTLISAMNSNPNFAVDFFTSNGSGGSGVPMIIQGSTYTDTLSLNSAGQVEFQYGDGTTIGPSPNVASAPGCYEITYMTLGSPPIGYLFVNGQAVVGGSAETMGAQGSITGVGLGESSINGGGEFAGTLSNVVFSCYGSSASQPPLPIPVCALSYPTYTITTTFSVTQTNTVTPSDTNTWTYTQTPTLTWTPTATPTFTP